MMRMKKKIGRWGLVGQVLYTKTHDDNDFYYALTSKLSLPSFKLELVVTVHICRVLG